VYEDRHILSWLLEYLKLICGNSFTANHDAECLQTEGSPIVFKFSYMINKIKHLCLHQIHSEYLDQWFLKYGL
jgi:hypothetical protein